MSSWVYGEGRWVCVCVSVNVQLSLWTGGDGGVRVSVTVQMGLWRGGDGCAGVNLNVQMGLRTGYGQGKYSCMHQCIIHSTHCFCFVISNPSVPLDLLEGGKDSTKRTKEDDLPRRRSDNTQTMITTGDKTTSTNTNNRNRFSNTKTPTQNAPLA